MDCWLVCCCDLSMFHDQNVFLYHALLDCLLSDIGLFQGQYVFLYHALLDGLQTGHLAYPVSQFHSLHKILCEDDVNLTQLREQFQVISMAIQSS